MTTHPHRQRHLHINFNERFYELLLLRVFAFISHSKQSNFILPLRTVELLHVVIAKLLKWNQSQRLFTVVCVYYEK